MQFRPPSPRSRASRLATPVLLVVALLVLAVSAVSLLRTEVVPRLDDVAAAGALTDVTASADATATAPAPASATSAAPGASAAPTTGTAPVPSPAGTTTAAAPSVPETSTVPSTEAEAEAEAGAQAGAQAEAEAPSAVPSAEPRPSTSAPAPAAADPSVEGQVITLVNEARAAAGCPALVADPALTAVARAHSTDMRDRGYFSHDTPEGVSPWDRADAAGISTMRAENIAEGQRDAAAVMAAWMDSPGHRENILKCEFRTIGVGVAQGSGGPWWTQDFGV